MNPGIRMEWHPTQRMVEDALRRASREYPTVKARILREFAIRIRDYLIDTIREGQFQENSARYRAWKEKHGFSTEPLLRTEDYINGIRYSVGGDGAISVFPTGHDRIGKRAVPYSIIAPALEMGTYNIPSRPHWAPTFFWAKQEAPEVGRRIVSEVFGISPRYRGTWDYSGSGFGSV